MSRNSDIATAFRITKDEAMLIRHGLINNRVTWLDRWVQGVIPDRAMMKETLARTESQLHREVR